MSEAILSTDGRYRYQLHRRWGTGRVVTWVMLNPSTADATTNDPTIRRCIGFAKAWGYVGLTVVNLYALRATDPRNLWGVEAAQAIGPDNDEHLRTAATIAALCEAPIVAAWGANPKPARVAQVLALPGMDRLDCLGLTQNGHPRHPLYVKGDTTLTRYAPGAAPRTPEAS